MAVQAAIHRPTTQSALTRITKHSDVMVAFLAVLIIGMMVVPLPPVLLDLLIIINITGALMIMLVTMYTTEPLQFSSFPSLLLLATLFRLSLNISATRLILLHASAGDVIATFGNFVVGGNYVVGLVVFLLLVIIQFVVITNGAGRVAEVAARFTLDAMPGKQMAIDADLNAGIIDEEQARKRRKTVSSEADFYGAMDGASKFVRGDAIAAIIMIIVNILGGFIVGVAQKNMDIMGALQTYTLLTVGEGLVSQIPALLISTATGLIVTRSASENNLGGDLTSELLGQPRALSLAAGVVLLLALVPGLPKIPFILVAGGLGYAAWTLLKQTKSAKTAPPAPKAAARAAEPEDMTALLGVDALEVEIGYGLIALADPRQGGEMLDRITLVRRQIAQDLGIIVPAVRVRDNVQLRPNEYSIKLRSVEIAKGEVYPGQSLAMNPGGATQALVGRETVEPAFGLPATWIPTALQGDAEMHGYTVVDPLTVLITHLSETIRGHADEIISRQDMQALVDAARKNAASVVDELIPGIMSVGDVQRIVQNLLRERVSIKDLPSVLEILADHARTTKDPDVLGEYVRQGLARAITRQHIHTDGRLYAFTLHPRLEQIIADSVRHTEMGGYAVLDPDMSNRVLAGTKEQIERMTELGYGPVCLCSPRVRPYFRRLVERLAPQLAVLSYGEVAPNVDVESTGMMSIDDGQTV
ncbi:MAG TPA: flagellar biosynthesis protein FlhA [Armatimonadota bacterium]|jgi:flagellar biosynthesis protein FlhA